MFIGKTFNNFSLKEYIGVYNMVKGSLIEEPEPAGLHESRPHSSVIEFFEGNAIDNRGMSILNRIE